MLTFNCISHAHTILWSLFSSQDFLWNCGLLRMCLGCCRPGKSPRFVDEEHGGSKYQGRQTFAPWTKRNQIFFHPPWAPSLSRSHWWFKSIPAGGDRWLWVICVLNITSRIHRECYFSWVIDWLVTPMSCGAQLVHRFELNHAQMYCQQSISKNLLILTFPFTKCHTA